MNLNQSESDINTEWILFYGISGYAYYPNRIRTESEPKWILDRTRNIQNFQKELIPNMISILNMYSKYIEHLK